MGTFDTITTGDGSAKVYLAGTGSAGAQGVLVLHPWWGLNDDVIAYADRLAEAGFTVAAPDLFDGQIATTVEGAEGLAHAADEGAVNAIVLAALDRLADGLDASATIAALGFSFGAHWAIWSPTQRDRVVATVLYYGTTGDNLDARRPPSWATSPRTTRSSRRRGSPSSSRSSDPPVATSSSTATRTPATGSPNRRATPTVPKRQTSPSSEPSRSCGRVLARARRPAEFAPGPVNRRRGSPGTRPGALRHRLEARASIRRSCSWWRPPSQQGTETPAR